MVGRWDVIILPNAGVCQWERCARRKGMVAHRLASGVRLPWTLRLGEWEEAAR